MRRWAQIILLLSCVIATARLVVWLERGERTIQNQRGWFWGLRPGEVGIILFALAVFALPLAVQSVVNANRHLAAKVVCLVVIGVALQHGLAFLDRIGLDGIRNRATRTGHAEFAVTASAPLDAVELVQGYEEFVRGNHPYARSKPPGHQLFYVGCARMADRIMPILWDPPVPADRPEIKSRRHFRLVNFATLFFPLLSMLPIVPLAYLGATLLGRERALWPSLLFMMVPSVQLVVMHLDQVLYPLLVTTTWALAAKAALTPIRRAWPWWIGCASVAWLSLFVTFSIAPALLPLVFVIPLMPAQPIRARALALASGALVFAASFLLWLGAFRWLLDYRILVAYRRGFLNHVGWNHWTDDMRWPAAKLDVSEFAYWTGVPLMALFLWQLVGGVRRWREPMTTFSWATLLAIAVTAIVGKTIGEVARLWLPFLPAVVLAAAAGLSRVEPKRQLQSLQVVVATQLSWIVALKLFQDFR